jgi:replicative DNA helicase
MITDDLSRLCPPNSIAAERTVIGAILQDDKATLSALGMLVVNDFYTPEHKEIFDAIHALKEQKQPIDIMTVSNELERRGTLSGIGDSAYLLSLCRQVPTTANARAYIDIVKDKSKLRMLIASCRKAEEACYTQADEIDAIAEELRGGLRGLMAGKSGGVVRAGEMASHTFEYIERKAKGDDSALLTGIDDLDRMTGGLMPGNLFIIGSRPSVGKSALAMDIALNVTKNAAKEGKKVLFFSREMSEIEFGLRIISNLSGIDGATLKMGSLGDMQWEQLVTATEDLFNRDKRLAFEFQDNTIEKIRAKAQMEYDENGLDLIVVDYLQLVETALKKDARYEAVGAVSRGLKELAFSLKIPIIALAQVGRAADKRCPTMAELRESGNIEQDADLILLLHRPEDAGDPEIPSYDKQAFMNITNRGLEYIVNKLAKQRSGARGTYGTAFDPAHMTIRKVDSYE